MGSTTTTQPPQVAFMGPIEEAIARLLPGVIAALPTVEERFLRPQEVSDKYGIAVKTVRRPLMVGLYHFVFPLVIGVQLIEPHGCLVPLLKGAEFAKGKVAGFAQVGNPKADRVLCLSADGLDNDCDGWKHRMESETKTKHHTPQSALKGRKTNKMNYKRTANATKCRQMPLKNALHRREPRFRKVGAGFFYVVNIQEVVFYLSGHYLCQELKK